ncbi:sulfatase family protein [Paraburkholderia xenovorans]
MSSRPNIVLIHCHDLGRWLSCYGMKSVPSPNLNAFADRAVVFEQAFSTAPLCSPARGSLFTGLSPHRHGLLGLAHHAWRYREDVVTLPEMLGPLGYDTALIGLQHENVDPSVLGFAQVEGAGFLPRAWQVVEAADAWLKRRSSCTAELAPFFLTVGMWEVHRPWPIQDYVPADPALVEVPQYLPDNAESRQDIAAFYGSIQQMDEAVGYLLDRIDEYFDSGDTFIVFTTDHGAAFPRAKGTLYDPGTGVALIVRPPRSWATSPGKRGELVSHLDIVPTCLELAGMPLDEYADKFEGASLVPLLKNTYADRGPETRILFTQKNFHDGYDPMRAVRSGRYKYIRNFEKGPKLKLSLDLEQSVTRRGIGDLHLEERAAEELYDLHVDPWEKCNLAANEHYQSVRAELASRLTKWMAETNDPLLLGPIGSPPSRTRQCDALPRLPKATTMG